MVLFYIINSGKWKIKDKEEAEDVASATEVGVAREDLQEETDEEAPRKSGNQLPSSEDS